MARTFAMTGRSIKNFEIMVHRFAHSRASGNPAGDRGVATSNSGSPLSRGRATASDRNVSAWPLFRRRRRLLFGIDLLAGYGAHDAADHHPVVLGQPGFDDAQLAD